MIPQLKSIFNKNQWVQIQNWVNGRLSLKQNIFDASNTASGTSSVTINATSGVATFTATVVADITPTALTITNSLITTSTKIRLGLSYSPSGDEMCAISAYNSLNGSVQIWFTNYSTVDATEPKIVDFQILS